MTGIRATNIEKTDQAIRVTLENNAVLETKTAIISTGASWRKLNIPGEDRQSIKVLLSALTVMVLYLKTKTLQLSAEETLVLKLLST